MPNRAAVAFEDVTVVLGGNTILDHVTASVPRGSCTAIVGPNGAGKTTLLLALLKQLAYSGRIRITCDAEGHPRIGYVPQRLQFDRGLPITVLEFMAMGWQRSPLWFGVRRTYKERALDLLEAVKVEALAQRKLGALSGGEIQRVLLALALGQNPDVLVLDEPAAGVDFQGEYVFCELLEALRGEWGFTQLMVSHDLATVTHHATHVICLNRKVAAEGPPRETLTRENLAAIFGLHMGLVDGRTLPDEGADRDSSCCMRHDHHA
jgi:zinc transport system ATP-binding protein